MATNTPPKLSHRHSLWGFAMAALAAIGFSTKAILAYFHAVDALTLLTLRMLFSLPFFALVALFNARAHHINRLRAQDYRALVILGLSGYYLSSLFDFIGLQYISAGMERLILFLYPTLVILLSAWLLRKPCGKKEVVALLLSYAGIAVVFLGEARFDSEQMWLGAGCVFASTLTYAFYLIGTGEMVARIGAIRFTAYAMLVACAATLLQFFATHSLETLLLPLRVYQLALLMALFSTVLPVFLLSASIRMIGSGHAALIGAIGPAITLLIANVVLEEALSGLQLGGAAMILIGVLRLTLK
jgi:drug/metabolite transporter (DMT)-like permease